ncbi:hypothetical protein [uncultured Treponema sp.]|uniref:hypothetical protein n=1 Tax=uncultured Treponema sp. TaxID=162155 RepID=UPI0025D85190|nr:hypothetical protein [uncultured Treponema sp.]
MDIIKISTDSLTLFSGLSQDSFSKTNTASLLGEKCTLIHIDNETFSSESYYFDSTRTDENGNAFFSGKAVKGKLLSNILQKDNSSLNENEIFALTAFCKSLEFASTMDDFSGTVGAGGIIIGSDCHNKKADILFISEKLFDECAIHNKTAYPQVQGKYLYKGLDFPASLFFLRAVVAYKLLTNHLPFEKDDTTKRQEDIYDENFIPLKLWNPEINQKLSESIENALRLKIKQEITAGKRAITDAKTERKRRKQLKKAMEFDTTLFKAELEKIAAGKVHDEIKNTELEAKRIAFKKKNESILSVKRFIRRNKNRILAGMAVVFVGAWWLSGFLRQNAKLVTTVGLDSVQTTHALYTMIHRIDVPNLQEILKGKETKDLFVKMSGFFVGTKQRLELSPDNGTLSPEKWFFYKKTSKNWMFGITNLKIDGKDFNAQAEFARRKDKPLAITQENGKILNKGDEITHTAEYFFIQQSEAKFMIEKMSDTVTLRWNGKKWNVVKIESKTKTENVKAKSFIEEYYDIVGDNPQDSPTSRVHTAIEAMRTKYEWIPREEDLRIAAESLVKEYGSAEAEKYLNTSK